MKLPFLRRSEPMEKKESAIGRIMVMSPGQPAWTKRDYLSFAKEAYSQNVIAYQCIKSIAEAVASVPLGVWSGDEELTDSPLLDLLARPNPQQAGAELVEAKVSYLLISGNCYDERVTVNGEPREIYTHRPDRMRVIPGATGTPAAYEYNINGRKIRWDVEPDGTCDLRHLKLFHPSDDWYGLAPTEAGAYSVDQHTEAMKWMQALLQNSARPSGALVASGENALSDEAFNRLKAQLEDQYQGSNNAGRPMLLEGGLDWKAMGLSPDDMGIIDAKHSAARDVALAWGVPPMLLGIPGDNTYANYQEARLAFWEDTVIPILGKVVGDWNAWLARPMGLELRPDLDQVPAIADKRRSLWEMVEKSTVLTINEKREAMGYEPTPGGDVLMVGMGQIALNDAGLDINGDATEEYDDAPPRGE